MRNLSVVVQDPYIRGRGAYHRNGNIIGNGLVSFNYPKKGAEGEWETTGYETSRETCLQRAETLENDLKLANGHSGTNGTNGKTTAAVGSDSD